MAEALRRLAYEALLVSDGPDRIKNEETDAFVDSDSAIRVQVFTGLLGGTTITFEVWDRTDVPKAPGGRAAGLEDVQFEVKVHWDIGRKAGDKDVAACGFVVDPHLVYHGEFTTNPHDVTCKRCMRTKRYKEAITG